MEITITEIRNIKKEIQAYETSRGLASDRLRIELGLRANDTKTGIRIVSRSVVKVVSK